MVKDRVKFSTKRYKKRKDFCGRKVVESENKSINVITDVNSDSSVIKSESLNVKRNIFEENWTGILFIINL